MYNITISWLCPSHNSCKLHCITTVAAQDQLQDAVYCQACFAQSSRLSRLPMRQTSYCQHIMHVSTEDAVPAFRVQPAVFDAPPLALPGQQPLVGSCKHLVATMLFSICLMLSKKNSACLLSSRLGTYQGAYCPRAQCHAVSCKVL